MADVVISGWNINNQLMQMESKSVKWFCYGKNDFIGQTT